MAAANVADQALKFGSRLVFLIRPQPERAVAIPAALVFRRFILRRVSQIEIVIERLQKNATIGGFVCRPQIIGMIVERDVDSFAIWLVETQRRKRHHRAGSKCASRTQKITTGKRFAILQLFGFHGSLH